MLATPRWHETGGQHPDITGPHDPAGTGQSHWHGTVSFREARVQAEAQASRATVAKVALDAALDAADAALVTATHSEWVTHADGA